MGWQTQKRTIGQEILTDTAEKRMDECRRSDPLGVSITSYQVRLTLIRILHFIYEFVIYKRSLGQFKMRLAAPTYAGIY